MLRIWLNFLMMTGFLSELRLDWGSVVRSIFNVAKASSGGLPPFVECAGVSFTAEMTFSLLLPVVVPCVPGLMMAAWALGKIVRGDTIREAKIMGVDKWRFFINACIAVANLLWPALVTQTLRVLDCAVSRAMLQENVRLSVKLFKSRSQWVRGRVRARESFKSRSP